MDLDMYIEPSSRAPVAANPGGDRQSRSWSVKRPPTDRARSKSPGEGSISAITPNLFVGDIHASRDITTLMRHKITAIVSLTKYPEYTPLPPIKSKPHNN